AEHLARGDLEVDAFDRFDAARIGLPEPPDFNRMWIHGFLLSQSRCFVRQVYDGREREDVTVNERDVLTEEFERHRSHLNAVAYRMLGSMTEAEDAVQESWFRLDRSDTGPVANLGGWLTTVVARVCLDMLRARRSRREEYMGGMPEPVVVVARDGDPEDEAVLADSVGLALLVVLDTLTPAERPAFVLPDMFGRPFAPLARPAIVNGAAGAIIMPGRTPIAVVGFTVAGGRIASIDLIANPEKLRGLGLGASDT